MLPPGIKGLSADSVFFSINNFNQKSFFKTIFEELKQSFLLNVYINVSDLLFVFAVHKLCRTAENSILHFVVGISHICCIIYKYVNTCSITYYLQQYNLTSFEPSIGLTPCCINQATTHERDRQRALDRPSIKTREKIENSLVETWWSILCYCTSSVNSNENRFFNDVYITLNVNLIFTIAT